jgi:hypothetical protein
MEMQQLIVTQQELLRYYGNAIGCIGHATKEPQICHNTVLKTRNKNECMKTDKIISHIFYPCVDLEAERPANDLNR